MLSCRTSAARIIASGLGSGFSPFAPGTAGSLVCLALWLILGRAGFHAPLLSPLAVSIVGLVTSRACLRELRRENKPAEDPQFIVIDEWAGMLFALYAVTPDQPLAAAAAFALFRMFDTLKPGPIGWLERLPGEWGIMADDVLGGVCASAVVLVLQTAVH